jgi:hypothetical protein
VCPRDRAVDAGEPQLRFSLRHHMGHDPIPNAAQRPTPEAQIRVMPVAKFGRDRSPFGAIVQPPDDRLDRAPILAAWTGTTNVGRSNRCFEFRPLGIRQNTRCLSPPRHNHIRGFVTKASQEMRTDPNPSYSQARDSLADVA